MALNVEFETVCKIEWMNKLHQSHLADCMRQLIRLVQSTLVQAIEASTISFMNLTVHS